jgi:hypothetical protein
MTTIQKNVVTASSIVALIGFALWFYFEPSFEPAIGVIASFGGLAASHWPRKKAKYRNQQLSGHVTFDYSNNNGRFVIGNGKLKFETAWSKASDDSIYVYNDPASIEDVALAVNKNRISDITDASSYDMSSRTRTPQEGEIVILKNKFGNFAALQIVDIKDRTRSDNCDELTFEYKINPEGNVDFS